VLLVWSKALVLMSQMDWFVCGFTFLDVLLTLSKGCWNQVLPIVLVDLIHHNWCWNWCWKLWSWAVQITFVAKDA